MKTDAAARLAIANVLKEGLTDIFPAPYELSLLKNKGFQKVVKNDVLKAITGGSLETLKISPIEHVLLPTTAAFDFRRCALMQPLDTIKYLTIALLFAEEIERQRPAKARRMVFSYRFAPQKGYIFDPKYNITSLFEARRQEGKTVKDKGLGFLRYCGLL